MKNSMEERKKIAKLRSFVHEKLHALQHQTDDAKVKAELAKLRRGIGKRPGEVPELLGYILEGFPVELYGWGNGPSEAEWAIYTTMTLFALHQQGKDIREEFMFRDTDYKQKQYYGLGSAVGRLVLLNPENIDAIRHRFYVAATAIDMKELSWHLRGIIQQLRRDNIPLDYASLVDDLYCYQYPDKIPDIRLSWGQDFYRIIESKDDKRGGKQ